MAKYFLTLRYAGEELDVDGYYRVEFNTSLPDPEFFGILNSSTRPWAVEQVMVLDENFVEIYGAPLIQTVLEPKHAIELPYHKLKEMLLERESADIDRDSPETG